MQKNFQLKRRVHMTEQKDKRIIVKIDRDLNDFYLHLKNNLDNQILEMNDKKFWGTINGNQIEVERKPRFYKNYKPIKFYGKIEEQTTEELKINGYFKEYKVFNYLAIVILMLIFNICEIVIFKIAFFSQFYMVSLLISLGFILLCCLINFNFINEDKREMIEFLSNK